MKLYAEAKRTERVFQVGDKVLLKLQPYTQGSVVSRPYPKLAFKYFSPYTVLERIGSVAYKLQLPEGSKIHNIFHVSQLKDFTPDYSLVFAQLPVILSLDVANVSPEHILERCLLKKGNVAVTQVLVKWSNLSESSATWEDFNVLRQRFPSTPAYGQAASSEGGRCHRYIKHMKTREADWATSFKQQAGRPMERILKQTTGRISDSLKQNVCYVPLLSPASLLPPSLLNYLFSKLMYLVDDRSGKVYISRR
jgi:hypothetical protein